MIAAGRTPSCRSAVPTVIPWATWPKMMRRASAASRASASCSQSPVQSARQGPNPSAASWLASRSVCDSSSACSAGDAASSDVPMPT